MKFDLQITGRKTYETLCKLDGLTDNEVISAVKLFLNHTGEHGIEITITEETENGNDSSKDD